MRNEKKQSFNVGVDMGGTKVAIGLVTPEGEILKKKKYATEAYKGHERIIKKLIREIKSLIVDSSIDFDDIYSIGVGVPGTVDLDTGEIILAPNINWRHIPLGKELRFAFPNIVCFIDQDTNSSALGEFWACKDPSINNLFFITISTGIGSGVIINRQLYRGQGNTAGEIGHMVMERNGIKCTCGNRGCLQAYAKGPAIIKEVESRIRNGENSLLKETLNKGNLTVTQIARVALEGDKLACSVILKAAEYVGIALANIIDLISPDLIVIGGGVALCGSIFVDRVINIAKSNCYPPARGKVKIKITNLFEDAGIMGASMIHTTME